MITLLVQEIHSHKNLTLKYDFPKQSYIYVYIHSSINMHINCLVLFHFCVTQNKQMYRLCHTRTMGMHESGLDKELITAVKSHRKAC